MNVRESGREACLTFVLVPAHGTTVRRGPGSSSAWSNQPLLMNPTVWRTVIDAGRD